MCKYCELEESFDRYISMENPAILPLGRIGEVKSDLEIYFPEYEDATPSLVWGVQWVSPYGDEDAYEEESIMINYCPFLWQKTKRRV